MQSKARMHDKSTEPLRTFAKAESACHHLGHPSTSAAILQAPDLKSASAVRWMLGPQSPRVKSNGAMYAVRLETRDCISTTVWKLAVGTLGWETSDTTSM